MAATPTLRTVIYGASILDDLWARGCVKLVSCHAAKVRRSVHSTPLRLTLSQASLRCAVARPIRCAVGYIACYWLSTWKAELALIYSRCFLTTEFLLNVLSAGCTVALWDLIVAQLLVTFRLLWKQQEGSLPPSQKLASARFSYSCFYSGQRPNSGPRRLVVSRSHTHTHPVGLLWISDQPVSEATNSTKHNRIKSMPSAGFELAFPAIQRL
jgi:hypothetical protein